MAEEKSKLAEKLENSTKFSEEEVNKVSEIRKNYLDIQYDFGQVSITRLRLEQQLAALDKAHEDLTNQFKENQKVEQDFLKEIRKKYGEGTLNPETGEFVKTSEK
tara:strand:+ start:156 stop:470 length:315 start_codon:yes stop_codon:yes gene_type:complete